MQQQQPSRQNPKQFPAPAPMPSVNKNKKYYFTQLALISTVLQQKLHQLLSPFKIDVSQIKLSQEEDICRLVIQSCWFKQFKEQQNLIKEEVMRDVQIDQNKAEQNFIVLKVYITILQMQTAIKFHVNYVKNQYQPLVRSKLEQKQANLPKEINRNSQQAIRQNYQAALSQKLPLKQSYSYIDEFWLNYTNYLPKKIYQTYHMEDLHARNNIQKYNKLLYIFQQRIARQIVIQAGYYDYNYSNNYSKNDNGKANLQEKVVKVKQLMTTVLANNYDKINRYLTPKDYKNLSICNRQIYRILHTQKNYKVIFERKWGRTGFELEEQNWIKLYKNKVLDQEKINRSKPIIIRGFYY